MRIESPGDLIYWTYFMIDWKEAHESKTEVKCSECAQPMTVVEATVGPEGKRYDGYVCHRDKRVTWVRGSGATPRRGTS